MTSCLICGMVTVDLSHSADTFFINARLFVSFSVPEPRSLCRSEWPISFWVAQISRDGKDRFLKGRCLAKQSEVWAVLLLMLWNVSTYWCQRSQDRLWAGQNLVPTACPSFGWASNLLPWHLHHFSLQNEQIWKYDLVYSILIVLVLMTWK